MSILGYGYAERHYNKQLAAAYATYMIVGSYYKSCSFMNKLEEEHLKMHYCAMKTKDQYRIESIIDRAAEKEFAGKGVEKLSCRVYSCMDGDTYYMKFIAGSINILVIMYSNGRTVMRRIAA